MCLEETDHECEGSWSRGKQPRMYGKVPKPVVSGKGSGTPQTARRWAWKQPSFEERVLAHWSRCTAPIMSRGSTTAPNQQGSRSTRLPVAERPVLNLCGDIAIGMLRSENADMSNDISCVNHDRRKFKGFCEPVVDAERLGALHGRTRVPWMDRLPLRRGPIWCLLHLTLTMLAS